VSKSIQAKCFPRTTLAACSSFAWLLFSVGALFAQTYDFGYVPLGYSDKASGFNFLGGSYDGTNLFMASESMIGPNAADFLTSSNYTGQELPPGHFYFYSLSYVPRTLGFETAALSTLETPSPPFGAGIMYLQGVGAPTNQPATGPIVPELAPLEQAMADFLAAHRFEAGTLAVMKDSKLVFRQGYGWRDTNFTTVIHPDNLFRLASVSKMLTASSIYKLIAAGKITTSTKIYDYLGMAPWNGVLGDSRITNITVQNLLDHSGGWNQYTSPVGDPMFRTIMASTNMGLNYPAAATNVIAWMFSKPLEFTPGTTNVYSNLGYSILGRVIEKASGKPYMDYIQQDLLGKAGLTNILGFANVIQSRSRPRDLAPWEIWYADQPQTLPLSAVDFPTNQTARFIDGGDYYEGFDSCAGLSASAVGLCHYLQNYLEGYNARVPGSSFSWDYIFYGSLPGASSVLVQNVNQNSTLTNGIEFAALFNERDDLVEGANIAAYTAISNAIAKISSWPANGGGMIQWSNTAVSINKDGGFINVPLVRSGANNLTVKVSYTTYALSATSSNFFPIPGVVTFGPGVTSKNITIPILNDRVIGPTRQFSLELISASGGAWLGDNLTCVVSILDTNSAPAFTGSPVRLPSGNLQFQTLCSTGLVMTVHYSTNLVDWLTLQTFTNLADVTTITDTNASGRSESFYRLSVP
jgi:CubicO group peptidase (beta-lactamase class C family)